MSNHSEENALMPGTRTPDGSIIGAVDSSSGRIIYIAEVAGETDHATAEKHAQKLTAHGHTDWRVPSLADWALLLPNIQNGALANTFNPAAKKTVYLSSNLASTHGVMCVDVKTGATGSSFKVVDRPVIYVRG